MAAEFRHRRTGKIIRFKRHRYLCDPVWMDFVYVKSGAVRFFHVQDFRSSQGRKTWEPLNDEASKLVEGHDGN